MKIKLILFFCFIFLSGCGGTKPPEWSFPPGMYSEEIDVYVKNMNKNKSILYTIDGKEPKKNKFFSPSTMEYKGKKYKVKMGQTLVIKYNAFRPGFGETGVRTLEYKVRNKLNEPVIHINKNVINISSNNNNYY